MAYARTFSERMKAAYTEARARYSETAAQIAELEKQVDAIKRSNDFTPKAKETRIADIRARLSEKKTELSSIQAEARQSFADIKSEARAAFPEFRLDSSAIDRDMLTLIDSGVCSAAEIMELVNEKDYPRTNATMCRLLGKRLDAIADDMRGYAFSDAERQRMSALAMQLQSVTSPIESALTRFEAMAESALRPDVLLADGIAESLMPGSIEQLDVAAAEIDG